MTVLKARIGGQWVAIGGASDYARWNSAWGAVAVGSFSVTAPSSALPAGVTTQVTNALPFTMLVGRNYRVVFRVRAISAAAQTAANVYLRDGTTTLGGNSPVPYIPTTYNVVSYDWFFAGDGVARSYNVAINAALAASMWADAVSSFYIEDIGPVSGAVPVPNPNPTWLSPSFATSWGAQSNTIGYRKIGDIVYLQGGVTWSGGSVASGAQTICTLPVGYRPPYIRRFLAWHNNTGTPCRNSVDAAGVVTIDDALTASHSWELSLIFSTS